MWESRSGKAEYVSIRKSQELAAKISAQQEHFILIHTPVSTSLRTFDISTLFLLLLVSWFKLEQNQFFSSAPTFYN